jgi:hypothetical protein
VRPLAHGQEGGMVVLSFAGAQWGYVERVAEALKTRRSAASSTTPTRKSS